MNGLGNWIGKSDRCCIALLFPKTEGTSFDLSVTTPPGGKQEVTFTKEDTLQTGQLQPIFHES